MGIVVTFFIVSPMAIFELGLSPTVFVCLFVLIVNGIITTFYRVVNRFFDQFSPFPKNENPLIFLL